MALSPGDQRMKVLRRFVIGQTVYLVWEDGSITWDDRDDALIGAGAYIAMSTPFINAVARAGIWAGTSSLTYGLLAIWAAGVFFSDLIDPEEGVDNFQDFWQEPLKIPERWYFTVDVLMNEGLDQWQERYSTKERDALLRKITTDTPITESNYLEIGGGIMGAHYISPIIAEGILPGYVYDVIMTQGYSSFGEQGIGIPPEHRMTAWKLALSQGQILISDPIYGG